MTGPGQQGRSRRTWPRCATGSPRRRGCRARRRGGDPDRRREVATRGADRGRARRRPAGVRRELRPGSPAAVAGPAADLARGRAAPDRPPRATRRPRRWPCSTRSRPSTGRSSPASSQGDGAQGRRPRLFVQVNTRARSRRSRAWRRASSTRSSACAGRARARGRGADGDPARGRRRGPAHGTLWLLARRRRLADLERR